MISLALLNISMLLAYVVLSCTGLVFMKRAISLMTPTFFFGFGMYGVGFLLWLGVLRRLTLSVAFPIAAGALVLGTMVAGYLFLNESVSIRQCIGALLIIVGIVVVYQTGTN